MNVSCPECRSVFRVDPTKVPANGVRARCSVCGGVITVGAGNSIDEEFAPSSSAVGATPGPAWSNGSAARTQPAASPAVPRPRATPPQSPSPLSATAPPPAAQSSVQPSVRPPVHPSEPPPVPPTVPPTVQASVRPAVQASPELSGPTSPGSAPTFAGRVPGQETSARPGPIAAGMPGGVPAAAPARVPAAPVSSPSLVEASTVPTSRGGPAVQGPPVAPPARAVPPASYAARPMVPPSGGLASSARPSAPSAPGRSGMPPMMPPAMRPATGPGAPRPFAISPAFSRPAVAAPPPSAPPPPPSATGRPSVPTPARSPINPFLANDPNAKARRLSRALVSDLVTYFPDRRAEGLRDGTLKDLFREEIKKSYEEYVDQVGREFAESTTHFQEALNEVLAAGQKLF